MSGSSNAVFAPHTKNLRVNSCLIVAWLFATLLVVFALPASGQQVNPGTDTGLPMYGSFQAGNPDVVSFQSLALHVAVPITSVRERGRSFSWSMLFDSPGWEVQWIPQPTQQDPANGQYSVQKVQNTGALGGGDWIVANPFSWNLGYTSATGTCPGINEKYSYFSQFYIQDPEGTKHQLQLRLEEGDPYQCYGNTLSSQATDGSGIAVTIANSNPPTVVSATQKDGTQVMGVNSWMDANGNMASSVADMLNRNVVSSTQSGKTLTLGVMNSNGVIESYTVQYTTFNIQTALCGINLSKYTCTEYSGTVNEVTKITLPTGLSYQFSYQNNSMLQLTQITLPTGGTISYTYNPNPSLLAICTAQQNGTRTPSYDCKIPIASRTVFDGTGNNQWVYSGTADHGGTTTVTDPAGNQQVHTFSYIGAPGTLSASPVETAVSYYQGSSTSGKLLKTVTRNWIGTGFIGDAQIGSTAYLGYLRVSSETTTLDNNQQSQIQTDFGDTSLTMNPTEKREYAFGSGAPGALIRRTDYSYLHTNNQTYLNLGILDRVTSVVTYDGSGNLIAQNQNEYDNYTQGIQGTSAVQHSSSFGSAYTTRGNVTATERWRNTDGTWLTTRNQYNDVGDIISTTDPNTNTTSYSYADQWANSSCAPPGAGLAYVTQITNAANEVTKHTYNSCTGLAATTTDPNSQPTTTTYDGMNRPLVTTFPDTGQTTNCYADDPTGSCYSSTSPLQVITTSLIRSGVSLKTTALYDPLGRISQTQLNSDPSGTVYVNTTYDSIGRVASVSNPYRSTSDSTYGITSFIYDGLNRKTQETDADGSNSIINTTYCGASTLVTDEAAHWRRSTTDAQGRLIEVDEPNSTTATVNACPAGGDPIWVTTYSYDMLNNMLGAVQGSSRTRGFTYNSLKQLLQSTNPESGTICYGTIVSGTCQNNGYDGDGNLVYKTDARGITTTYTYDNVNRLKSASYSNGDPTVTYTYSETSCLGLANCYNIGRRTSMTDAAGTEHFAYDTMGREWEEQRTSNSVTKNTSYLYDLLGDLTSLTYPTGRTITYAYDTAGRPLSAIDQANSINYALNATYAPQGALAGVDLGGSGGVNLTQIYNSRLQPCWLYATTGTALSTSTACSATDPGPGNILDLQYNFSVGAGDNGNVIGITNNRNSTRTQSFSYDQVNRIMTAKTSSTTGGNCWGETFTYDQWANLTAKGALSGYGSCTQESLSVTATTNNQLSFTGSSYDASGNMLNDGVNAYTFNAESEIKSAAGVNYTYDGDGNRVEKSNGKLYWYGAGTEILDESSLSGSFTNEYVFFGGKRIAMRNVSTGTIYYYAEDFLGSSRTIVQAGGTSPCYDADFYPFGGERDITNTCSQNYKFEGKERDTETNNDDFGARYYSSRLGRWMSADWSAVPAPVPYANQTNPQTLNLYAMVNDNPESFADLSGHDPENPSTGAPASACQGTECDKLGAGQATSTTACVSAPVVSGPLPCTTTSGAQQVSSDQQKLENEATARNTTTVGFLNSQSVTSKDGSTTTTTNTITNVTFSETGKVVGATQSTITEVYDNTKQSLSSVKTTDPTSISEKQAVGTVGTRAFNDARESALPSLATQFGRVTAEDARAHPFKYAGAAASAAISVIDPPATIGAAVRALVPAVLGLLDSTTGSN